ncbi:MAG: hypothetical protein U0234_27970 [Sandaracinus sp.]
MDEILKRVLREAGPEAMVEALAERLSPSDLSSLLLEVAARRAAARTPAEVRRQYESDRFVRPGTADALLANALERAALETAAARGFSPILPSPLAPLAACASVATVSQNKIVSTMRGTEVASDTSNLLALEASVRRAADPSGPVVSLCASQRVVRAQPLARPEFRPHFHLFVTVAAGRDPGGRTFEAREVERALVVQLDLVRALAARGHRCEHAIVALSPDRTHTPVAERVAAALGGRFPGVPVEIDGARIAKSGYYRGLCFGLWIQRESDRFPLGDGGLTDWVAKLTSSRKERCLVGAVGLEALASALGPR